jgi:PAS domain S-box-containing protein
MENLNALFYFATEGIIIANDQGIIVKANPSAEKIFGYDKDGFIGLKIEELIPSRYKEKHISHREQYSESPHPRSMGKNMDLFARRKDNSEFSVEISLSPFKDATGRYVIAFIIDISERKLHEENIKKLNHNLENKVKERTKVLQEALHELESSKEKLSKALEKEKGLNEMKSRFVSMASHEFRTPLSTILSSVSLISKYHGADEDEKRQKHVQKIKSSVTNMTLILNDFLSEDRLQEGKVLVNKVSFSIKKMCEEILSEIAGLKKTGPEIIYTHIGEEDVFSDTQINRNIILNLLSNAIKFTEEYKTITMFTKNLSNQFVIEVTDEGIGIPQEEQQNMFTRFFRARNVTNIQGTGLGLSIVFKYIEILDGTIGFKSELNKGTTFSITLSNN